MSIEVGLSSLKPIERYRWEVSITQESIPLFPCARLFSSTSSRYSTYNLLLLLGMADSGISLCDSTSLLFAYFFIDIQRRPWSCQSHWQSHRKCAGCTLLELGREFGSFRASVSPALAGGEAGKLWIKLGKNTLGKNTIIPFLWESKLKVISSGSNITWKIASWWQPWDCTER